MSAGVSDVVEALPSGTDAGTRYRGEGVRLHDGDRSWIDCASGTFNLALGYSNDEVRAALHEQLDRCAHLASEFSRDDAREVFERLRPHLPEHIGAFWFRDVIGSTATEGAIKIAQKATGRSGIVSLFLSHHGQTIAATGASGNAFRHASFELPLVGSVKMPAPHCASCFYEKTPDTCGMLCARRLHDFVEHAASGEVAAVVVEPVLGNGGNIVPPPGYYGALREACDAHGILVVADEVQTGFGRTGTFFASTGIARDLRPDIITFGKGAGGIGIPAAGIVMRPELDVLEPWEHSTTSGANPLALSAMVATTRYIEEHGVLDDVRRTGRRLLDGLVALERDVPAVRDARGVGLMLGFDLPSSAAVSTFIEVARDHGLLLRGSRYGRGNTVKVRPPLVVTDDEVEEILAGLGATCADRRLR